MAFKKGHVPIKPFLKGFTPWNKGKKMSGESREKMSIAKKGRPAWNKGKKGKPHSEEWKKKMSLIHKGRKCSEETKKKISIKNKGKKRSKEMRKRISTAHIGQVPWSKGKKFSDEYKKKLSDSHIGQISWNKGKPLFKMRGEKHPNWKGGITPENTRIRRHIEYDLWRSAVLLRDNYICQKYGTRGGKLHAHHIQNFSQYPELRFAIDNGITLSDKAHKEFHKKYGTKNNTREQLEEFLKN